MKKKLLLLCLFVASITIVANAQRKVVFNPETYDAANLGAGMSIVQIDGKKYLQVILSGWNSSFPVTATLIEGETHFQCMVKYAVNTGVNTYAITGVNTFLKIVDNSTSAWTELAANGAASTAAFAKRKIAIAKTGTITNVQIAGQETTGWSAVSSDTMWIGAITIFKDEPDAIFSPAALFPGDLGTGQSVVTINGKSYLQVILNGWNSSFPITPVQSGKATHFKCEVKYAVNSDSNTHAITGVNTFLKIVDNTASDWKELAASGAGSTADFAERKVAIATPGLITNVQIAGQETAGWSAVKYDTLWIGRIDLVFPVGVKDIEIAQKVDVVNIANATDYTAVANISWDAENFMITLNIKDDAIYLGAANAWLNDNIEIYFDMTNGKIAEYPRKSGAWPAVYANLPGYYQFRLVPDSSTFDDYNGGLYDSASYNVVQRYKVTDTGYIFSVVIPWAALDTDFVAKEGAKIGFDILASDNDGAPDYRDQVSWNALYTSIWSDPAQWGTIELVGDGGFKIIKDTEAPATPANVAATVSGMNATVTWDMSTDNIVVQEYIVLNGTTQVAKVLALKTGNKATIKDLAVGKYTFSVKAVDLYGNTSAAGKSNEVEVTEVGINNTTSTMSMYPNPVVNSLNIRSTDLINSVTVYSITGQIERVAIVGTNYASISFEGISSGTYFVKVQTGSNVSIQRIVKR
jgi:hypothetical protein